MRRGDTNSSPATEIDGEEQVIAAVGESRVPPTENSPDSVPAASASCISAADAIRDAESPSKPPLKESAPSSWIWPFPFTDPPNSDAEADEALNAPSS
ncbi:MAG: hypothetical protein BWY99_02581 [Synergistetes bacterium ADurb.BinA166]|nr:MAG: hypothetical protein BWY99_02581 [Synergistetes bacterium ADurb.BinA166]